MADEIKKDEVQAEVKTEVKAPTTEDLMKEIASLKAEKEKYEQASANLKKSTSEACADAAEWKRKYRATLDEATRKEQEQADKFAEMEAKLNEYEARDRKSNYLAKLIGAGYSPEAASRMAEGLPAGVPDSFFDEQKAFIEAQKQTIKTQTINAQPNLPVGEAPSAADAKAAEDAKYRAWFGLK